MTDLAQAKAVSKAAAAALDAARANDVEAALAAHTTPDWLWRGVHPFEVRKGARDVAPVWVEIKGALTHLHRRDDVFFAGENVLDHGGTWVVRMGHLVGLFDTPWLGIAPTGRMAFLRYCQFERVDGDRIAETAFFCDIPHLMTQAGCNPFPPQLGAHLIQPGPLQHIGLIEGDSDPLETRRTIVAIDRMMAAMGNWDNPASLEEELRQSWHEDMIWWGPAGIGATYTIPRYIEQHVGPFRRAFGARRFNGHIAKLAEGRMGGFFGWPNLTLRHDGGFMGLPGSDRHSDMRVIDIYMRRDDKLAENWIFIDLLHWMALQGVDVLGRLQGNATVSSRSKPPAAESGPHMAGSAYGNGR